MSTIVMRVDLDCEKCYKKIRKVLCKIQGLLSSLVSHHLKPIIILLLHHQTK